MTESERREMDDSAREREKMLGRERVSEGIKSEGEGRDADGRSGMFCLQKQTSASAAGEEGESGVEAEAEAAVERRVQSLQSSSRISITKLIPRDLILHLICVSPPTHALSSFASSFETRLETIFPRCSSLVGL